MVLVCSRRERQAPRQFGKLKRRTKERLHPKATRKFRRPSLFRKAPPFYNQCATQWRLALLIFHAGPRTAKVREDEQGGV